MTVQTEIQAHEDAPLAPQEYWFQFSLDWDTLAREAFRAGQDQMAEFFGELADDAADVWAGLYGPLS